MKHDKRKERQWQLQKAIIAIHNVIILFILLIIGIAISSSVSANSFSLICRESINLFTASVGAYLLTQWTTACSIDSTPVCISWSMPSSKDKSSESFVIATIALAFLKWLKTIPLGLCERCEYSQYFSRCKLGFDASGYMFGSDIPFVSRRFLLCLFMIDSQIYII